MLRYLICFLISMVPLAELRVAVMFAQGYYAADPSFNIMLAYILMVIGNMLPVPFIFFFARKVLEWGKDKPDIMATAHHCFPKDARKICGINKQQLR